MKPPIRFILVLILFIGIGIYWFLLPSTLFQTPYSTALYDRNNNLLSAQIAEDEQWRFYPTDSLPNEYKIALTLFEDEQFYKHKGVNILALLRALRSNLIKKKIVSGGSTITMQLIRMTQKNPPRTILNKIKEIILATRLELSYSKEEILRLYASHAPYGGNIVGIQAASRRYYDKKPSQLSWAEVATLAVLPNSPSLIYPGKNQESLRFKRDKLLNKIHARGYISELDLSLFKEEPIPEKWYNIPQHSPHLLQFLKKKYDKYHLYTSINPYLTNQVHEILNIKKIDHNNIGAHNVGVIIINNKNNQVEAYIGNHNNLQATHAPYVDMNQALRSPGSLIKPILFIECIEKGFISPQAYVYDLPRNYDGYSPTNFNGKNEGIVKANEALRRSLNVPFINLLQIYGLDHFYDKLSLYGIDEINKGASHYGLSIILGSGESTLWTLTNTYAGLAKTLNFYLTANSIYTNESFEKAHILPTENKETKTKTNPPVVSAGAIGLTVDILKGVQRPDLYGDLAKFNGSEEIAWKTGTSIGFRDAWAIGMTPDYTVGVWVGNADGEGRSGLIGSKVAAPVLFEVFRLFPRSEPWDLPYDDIKLIKTCQSSYYKPTSHCPIDSIYIPVNSDLKQSCRYHKKIFLDESMNYRVYRQCYDGLIIDTSWLVFPPKVAFYYENEHHDYIPPPRFSPKCTDENSKDILGIVYPHHNAKISLPQLDGSKEKLVCTAYHGDRDEKLFWFLNDRLITTTQEEHTCLLDLESGQHSLSIEDQNGNKQRILFEIID